MEYAVTTSAKPIDSVNEVSPGYQSAPMKSLLITLRLPVRQMHTDEETVKNVFMPLISLVVLNHSTDLDSFEVVFNTEKESMVCEAKFFGVIDISKVEKSWNTILELTGYAQAAENLDTALERVKLSRLQFSPASTFVAEY